jgi:hypothetical protein
MPTTQPSTHPHVIPILTDLPILLLTYTVLTLINENNANAGIAFSWLPLN